MKITGKTPKNDGKVIVRTQFITPFDENNSLAAAFEKLQAATTRQTEDQAIPF